MEKLADVISDNPLGCLTLREKFPNTEFFWSVFSRIKSKCGKLQTRKTPYLETFLAV